MNRLTQRVLLPAALLAALGLAAPPARADVVVTVYSGNPVGAGNGGPTLDFSGLTQLGSFLYDAPQFGIWSRSNNDPNNAGNWRPFYQDTNYSARITGQIQVATSGMYNFSTTSDDGSILRIDGNVVVNNNFFQAPTTRSGSVFLQAGIHNFEVQFFQGGGGKSLDVGSAPAGAPVSNPLINQLPAGVTIVNQATVPHLNVNVYAGQNRFDQTTGALVNPGTPLIGSFTAPAVNFDYATGSQWSPFGRGDDFSASITGRLSVAANGTYTFGLNSDDGSWLFIDGNLVVNNGGLHGSNQTPLLGQAQQQGSVTLTAGEHDFEVRMFEAGGGQGVTLFLPNGVTYALTVVPEPGVLTLTGIGAGVLALVGWRRRRVQAVK